MDLGDWSAVIGSPARLGSAELHAHSVVSYRRGVEPGVVVADLVANRLRRFRDKPLALERALGLPLRSRSGLHVVGVVAEAPR